MFLTAMTTISIYSANPYLPLYEHLPDGEPRVFEDPDAPGKYRVYIIGSHDMRTTEYCGADIRMWSAPTDDLNDWRDEGPIFTYQVDGKWDVMYAPDLVEVNRPDGTKEYYLYPHSRGPRREAMVCKSSRPDGPFTPINLNEDGTATVTGSVLGFDPSIYVEPITDPSDPDFAQGFRAYGFWGFQRSLAAELDPGTMYSVRPGTEIIPYFIPASHSYGSIRDPQGTTYPALYSEQKPEDFNFFEASSIRKVGNKYIMIFSGYSGPDYGLGSTNSTLRYAYGDSPLGPWRSGGVLVDSRGIVPDKDGVKLQCTNAAHNTHGSLQEINGQWYVFYHRPPRGFGFARQPMVAPVKIVCDETPVKDGGRVLITGYDPYTEDETWTASSTNGDHYQGAEVTSEGFNIFGLDPYQYYSAGYACYLSNVGSQQDSWDIWNNNMPIDVRDSDIIGFKYFGFGGLDTSAKGIKPFKGTRKGNDTAFNIFLTPTTDKSFKIAVWLDGPWDNAVWKGKKIGEITIPANSAGEVTKFTANVASYVDHLDKKHAIFLVAEGNSTEQLCRLNGIGFSSRNKKIDYPQTPKLSIKVDGTEIDMPSKPIFSTTDNGLTELNQYEVYHTVSDNQGEIAEISATADMPEVKIDIVKSNTRYGTAKVVFDYLGKKKTYNIHLEAPKSLSQR
ncbi:MAG: hypothetical protein NC127_07615 [Muribaculum sp.]|nr:hypothetical protein [Muribaculum sp.]